MSLGKIAEASRATGDEATWTSAQGKTLDRWNVTIDANGKTVKTTVLRTPEKGDPSGEDAYLDTNTGRWKVGSQGPPQSRNGGGGGGRSPADTKAIQRQHSQEMGIRAVALEMQAGTFKPTEPKDFTPRIRSWTDYFENDISA